jgi:hypothetical protein
MIEGAPDTPSPRTAVTSFITPLLIASLPVPVGANANTYWFNPAPDMLYALPTIPATSPIAPTSAISGTGRGAAAYMNSRDFAD